MKKFGIIFAIILLCTSSVWAANTVTLGDGFMTIVLDSADMVWSTQTVTAGLKINQKLADIFPDGLALVAVKFYASAANDKLVLRNKSLTGPIISQMISIDGGALKEYMYGKYFYKPYIEWDNQTQSTPANALITLEFSNPAR